MKLYKFKSFMNGYCIHIYQAKAIETISEHKGQIL